MPLYDYECLSCGNVFELRQGFDADPEGACPLCEGMSRRKFHAVPIIYKGSGFYTTDYKRTSTSYTSDSKEEKKEAKEKSTTPTASTDDSKEKTKPAKATTDSSKEKSEAAKEA